MNEDFWRKAQNLNPRILYVIALVVIALPLTFTNLAIPIQPNAQTIRAYNAIEEIGKDPHPKLAIIDGGWSASTRGENSFQQEAIMEHLMRLHIPFALICFTPQNRVLSQQMAQRLAPKYNYKEGTDWVNWGFKLAPEQTLKGMAKDISKTLEQDVNHQKLDTLPIMKNVHTFKDISLIVEVTPTSSLDTWLGLVQGINHTPIVYAPTAVMAPEGYPFLDSGQIKGIVTGVAGAGDYETLLHVKGDAIQVATALSFVYALIIILIIVGNIGYYMNKSAASKREAAE